MFKKKKPPDKDKINNNKTSEDILKELKEISKQTYIKIRNQAREKAVADIEKVMMETFFTTLIESAFGSIVYLIYMSSGQDKEAIKKFIENVILSWEDTTRIASSKLLEEQKGAPEELAEFEKMGKEIVGDEFVSMDEMKCDAVNKAFEKVKKFARDRMNSLTENIFKNDGNSNLKDWMK